MASRAETATVYAAGLVQGIALVTFPAASTIFTEPSQYGLSSSPYGTMFVPQVVTAVTTGGVIAFYQVRYGIAAFGAGPLVDAGVGLPTLFGCAAAAAVLMGGLSFMLTRKRPATVTAAATRLR